MGVVGAVLVARWSLGLLRTTSVVLLDREGPDDMRDAIKRRIEEDEGNRVTDLHLWAVGPRLYSAVVGVATDRSAAARSLQASAAARARRRALVVEVHAASPAELPAR